MHAVAPAIAVPVQKKDLSVFEVPDIHWRKFNLALKYVSRLIVIGWRGAEQHFMDAVYGSIQFDIPFQVVSKDHPDTVAALLRGPQGTGLGLTGQSTEVGGGFSDFVRSGSLETFLNAELPDSVKNLPAYGRT